MKNILIILKKELKRFFTDRRMLLAMFLPGILIFIIYRAMGSLMSNVASSTEPTEATFNIAYTDNYAEDTNNKPLMLLTFEESLSKEATNPNKNKAEFKKIAKSEVNDYVAKLKNNEVDLVVEFSDNFETQISAGQRGNNINFYYNGKNGDSESLYSMIRGYVSVYDLYTENMGVDNSGNPVMIKANVDEEGGSAMLQSILAFVLPMVTVSLLYSTVISFCPESISGEKERGTLASVLMTPIKKSEFVIGKIIALSLVAIASGLVSFLGLIFSLPSMMGGATLSLGFGQTILLMLIMITMLLFFVGLGVLVSALANTVKEAGSYLGPLSLVFMIGAIVPIILGSNEAWLGFIPVVNFAASISALTTGAEGITLLLTFTVLSNLVYTGLLVFAVTRIFNQEKMLLGH